MGVLNVDFFSVLVQRTHREVLFVLTKQNWYLCVSCVTVNRGCFKQHSETQYSIGKTCIYFVDMSYLRCKQMFYRMRTRASVALIFKYCCTQEAARTEALFTTEGAPHVA